MDSNKVDAFIISNSNRLPESQINLIRETLLSTDESKTFSIQAMQFKDPTIALIISLIGGSLGVDRFYIGNIGLGIAKLITCGGCGLWTLIDLFLIMGATRNANLKKLKAVLYS